MNLLHYPSLELCKKLTEIGFPKTERWYILKGEISWIQGIELTTTQSEKKQVCPNVMEMLDVIPMEFNANMEKNYLVRGNNRFADGKEISENPYLVGVYPTDYIYHDIAGNTLPNALAEMVLWLVENKHLSFNK